MVESAATIALGYLLGAFPTAYLVGRRLGRIDILRAGSQNVGALNAYRLIGKWAGLFVLIVDVAKGALAVYIGLLLGVQDIIVYVTAGAATLGHNFSPFLGFKGGKGVATVMGISAVMLWHLTAIAAAGAVVLLLLTRKVVLSMTVGFIILNALAIGTSQAWGQIGLCLVLSFLVGGTHILRQYPELLPALRRGKWSRLMSIE